MGFDAFAKMAGFDAYYGKNEYNNNADFDGIWGIWDEPFFQFYANTISTFKEPFGTALFSVSSHHPFKVPEKYEGVFPKGTLPIHQCVGYTDMALRRFFETASKTEWYKNTLFIITADHSVPSHFPEYKTNINGFAIPLVFYAPGLQLKGVNKRLAQQIDILPTLMHLIGYSKGFVAFGNDLMKPDSQSFVLNYSNESYQFMKGDSVYYFDGERIQAFYDYKTDPFLSHNLKKNGNPDEAAVRTMKAFIQQYINRMVRNELTVNETLNDSFTN
jgi:phosphoglycerol transferase MdoB-like AlkP superfamily enzyme